MSCASAVASLLRRAGSLPCAHEARGSESFRSRKRACAFDPPTSDCAWRPETCVASRVLRAPRCVTSGRARRRVYYRCIVPPRCVALQKCAASTVASAMASATPWTPDQHHAHCRTPRCFQDASPGRQTLWRTPRWFPGRHALDATHSGGPHALGATHLARRHGVTPRTFPDTTPPLASEAPARHLASHCV